MNDPGLIVRIAARGEGVTADGRFVPLAAPDDRVTADGRIAPGPHHATPPCRHFPVCGGCQLQHVSDTAYARYLVDRIAGALAAQGVDVAGIAEPHLSPPGTRRRASFRAERRGKSIAIGFNEGASNRVVDLNACHVLLPEIMALLGPLRGLLAGLLPDRGRGTVTITRADQGLDLLLGGVAVEGVAAAKALPAFGARHNLARLSVDEGDGPSARYAPLRVSITLGGVPVELPDGAFLQATTDGESVLVDAVRTAVGDARRIADLFAGLGTFALSLPNAALAVEGARDAALALKATGRVAVEHRDLFRRPLTRTELKRFDAVVIDPPRAGAKEQMAELAASQVPRIAYVSCNPATFARDAKVLIAGGYRLDRVTPVGQFRWSTHVELAAEFSR